MSAAPTLPHPRTGAGFPSPVPPAAGWPGDPAGPATPVARSAADVVRLAGGCADLAALDDGHVLTPRDQPYWGRPAPGFGDPHARLLVVGLAPAAHGANRTGHR